jgi:hypothetical protein
MASQTAKSGFLAAAKAHARDETRQPQDFTELPGGIVNGVAELREAKIGVYKPTKANDAAGRTGQNFLYLGGVVLSPKTAVDVRKVWDPATKSVRIAGEPQTVPVEGLRTNKTLPLCAERIRGRDGQSEVVPGDENIADALNVLRLVAGDEVTHPLASATTEEQSWKILDSILAAIRKAKPRFRFNTRWRDPTEAYPNSAGTWPHDWFSGVPSANGQPWEDGPDVSAVAETVLEGPAVADSPDESSAEEGPIEEGATREPASVEEGSDLRELAARAVDKAVTLDVRKRAQTELIRLAKEAGCAEDDVRNAKDWIAVVEMIESARSGEAETAEEEAVEWTPAVGEIYPYPALVKNKAGKLVPGRAETDHEVKAVDAEKRTVDLAAVKGFKNVRKAVPWDKIEPKLEEAAAE